MSIAWFIAPYKRGPGPRLQRYCAMDDFTSQINADGGIWDETEVLGNFAIVKVSASDATLATIAATLTRLPCTSLSDSLSTLTAGQKSNLLVVGQTCGYTLTELNTAIPDLSQATFGQFLDFLATRRLMPTYHSDTDTIVCDGPVQPVKPVVCVDLTVQ